jgi:hypothetical protein
LLHAVKDVSNYCLERSRFPTSSIFSKMLTPYTALGTLCHWIVSSV